MFFCCRKIVLCGIIQPHQVTQRCPLYCAGIRLQRIPVLQPLRDLKRFLILALIMQEKGVLIQHVWLYVVFRCQCGDVLIDSDDFSSILRCIALSLIGVDQRFLTGDIFQDRIFFDFNDFLRLADLLFHV